MTKFNKKTLLGIGLLAIGLLWLLFALISSLSKKDDEPKTDNAPIVVAPQAPTETVPQPTAPQPAPVQLDQNLLNGQLSTVHGFGNKGELVAIPKAYTQKDEFIHADVYAPLMAMIKAAEADGIRISIVSAYRSYDHQKRIWERKWGNAPDNDVNQALKNLEYSSFPGTSRHHWGTDIDFNSVSPAYWQNGEGKRTHDWLVANAPLYGFCQTYGDNRSTGYANEDWHWSHLPTASRYYELINNPQVLSIATHQPLKGAAAVQQLDNQLYGYIRGISPCRDTVMTTNQAVPPQPAQAPSQVPSQAVVAQPQPILPTPPQQQQPQPIPQAQPAQAPQQPAQNNNAGAINGQQGSW